jgi:hypothetical protein
MAAVKKPNPNVSGALLKALSTTSSSRQPSPISNKEWSDIKKTAMAEVTKSTKPTSTLAEVKTSFQMADRLTNGKYTKQFGDLAGELTAAAKKTQEKAKQLDTNDWSRGSSTGPSRPGRSTGISTGGGSRGGRSTGVSTGSRGRTVFPGTGGRTRGTTT